MPNFKNICNNEIFIEGIAGSGKTRFVECAAGYFGMPLFRLDCRKQFTREKEISLFSKALAEYFSKEHFWTIVLFDDLDYLVKNPLGSTDHSEGDANLISKVYSVVCSLKNINEAKVIFIATSSPGILTNDNFFR